jgi:hypothetical protein
MANTKTLTKLVAGSKVRVVYLTLVYVDAQETDYVVYDSSDYGGTDTLTSRIMRIAGVLSAASAARAFLEWDATTDVAAFTLPIDRPFDFDFNSIGGLKNTAGSGITGDIALTTTGLAAGDTLTLILEVDAA